MQNNSEQNQEPADFSFDSPFSVHIAFSLLPFLNKLTVHSALPFKMGETEYHWTS